jgi:hypothetical protein
MFLYSIIINLIAAIIAYFIMKYAIIKNLKIPNIVEYFSIYGLTSISIILIYIKGFYDNVLFLEILITFIYILYYLRSIDSSRKKYHERFRSMILSFGYTRSSYFETFLSKKIINKILESFFYGVGIHFLFNVLLMDFHDELNIFTIITPTILFFIASLVKTLKTGNLYKVVK